jgi:hypothetical protein
LLNVNIDISPDSRSQEKEKRKKLLDWNLRLEAMDSARVSSKGHETLVSVSEEGLCLLIRCHRGCDLDKPLVPELMLVRGQQSTRS